MSRIEVRKKLGEDSGNAKLLKEIETISKALYLDKNHRRPSLPAPGNRSNPTGKTQIFDSKSKIKQGNEESSNKDNKKSIWNWKPLKALSNVRNRKFNCCFSLQVHTIDGFPLKFENLSICVHWKRRDGELVTRPVKVSEGIAEFEENLVHNCMVYGSRSGPHHSAKYEAKHFLLFTSIIGFPELDLGKHRVDLTRLLPLTLEELEEEKSSGKWTTSFKLSGEAKGALLNVSFGYTVVGDGPIRLGDSQKELNSRSGKPVFNQGNGKSTILRNGSLPSTLNQKVHGSSRSVEDVKDLHEVLPTSRSDFSSQALVLYQKFDETKVDLDSALDCKAQIDASNEHVDAIKSNFNPVSESSHENIEQGEELSQEEQEKPVEVTSEASLVEKVDIRLHDQDVGGGKFHNQDVGKFHDLDAGDGKFLNQDVGDGKFQDQDVEDGKFQDQGVEDGKFHDQGVGDGKFHDQGVGDGKFHDQGVGDGKFHDQDVGDGKFHDHDVGDGVHKEYLLENDSSLKEDEICSTESVMKELEVALNNVTNLEAEALDFPEKKDDMEMQTDYGTNKTESSLSLDDVTESVANDFLEMLGIEHSPFSPSSESEPESPRERLLRQFEKDALAEGYSLFDFGIGSEDGIEYDYSMSNVSEWGNLSDDFELAAAIQAAEQDHHLETYPESGKIRAKLLEDLETEALMRQWGLNDEAFKCSPSKGSASFGSPIDLPPEELPELPLLGEGLGPCLQTSNGGYLRSMNPSLFKNAKNGGSLIMQVSSPVVVPAEMGSGITDVLKQLASAGIEKLSIQANKLMPLEDITGKTMHQLAWEASDSERENLLQNEVEIMQDASGGWNQERSQRPRSNKFKRMALENEMESEYVSLEGLAPLAMDKIEALSIEGLRVQSGMSDEDAPANINAKSIGEISAFQGKGIDVKGSLDLEGVAGLQLLDIKDDGDDVDGLMGLSLTLDEWMRLDSGDIGDEDEISEQTSKILAAHHASSLDAIRGGSKGERRRSKGSSRKCGLLGNNFTVALMVQLRDPLRDFEPVGTPMLALIQVERVFVPPKPKIYCKVSELRYENDTDDESETMANKKAEEKVEDKPSEEEGIPHFCITEVQVAGLKAEPGKKPWGTTTQQQAGSRWLLANGMGKGNKQSILKGKATANNKPGTSLTTKAQRGDTLWSISSRKLGGWAK